MAKNYGSINVFSPTEFISLNNIIHTNIIFIKKQIQKLDKSTNVIGTKNDNSELRGRISQIQQATSEKVDSTYKELKRLSDIIKFTNDKTQKLQVEKAISDFQMIVQKYAKTEKSLTLKMRNVLLVDMVQQDEDAEQDDTEDLQQKMMHANFKFENELLIEREQNVNLIESNVLDVNEMMNNLSSLLSAQGESIQSIADVIEDGTSNIAEGTSELEKAASSQSSFRKKVVFILLIAIIIALIVVFSIYSKLKK